VPGAFAGLLIINILRNDLNLIGVSPYWQYVVRGFILISVVVMDAYFNLRKRSE
jgi:ribose transport system permease protein